MGEMVMKKIPDSRTDISAGTDRKQRRQSLAVTGAVALCFVLSAFTFMNFMYCLSDSVGSFVSGSADVALRGVLRSLPIWLSFFLSLCGLMTAQVCATPDLRERVRGLLGQAMMRQPIVVMVR